jgi:hypothetical protein
MQDARFGLEGSLAIDLGNGALSDPDGTPGWLVPVDVLSRFALAEEAPAAALGELIGVELGKRLTTCITLETDLFVEHLAGECAIRGYGKVSLERWGEALVVRTDSATLPGAFLAAFFSGVLKAASRRDVRCALLGESDRVLRFLVCAPDVALRVSDRLAAGESWRAAIVALSGPGRGAS